MVFHFLFFNCRFSRRTNKWRAIHAVVAGKILEIETEKVKRDYQR
jgi:hypothetical protein